MLGKMEMNVRAYVRQIHFGSVDQQKIHKRFVRW